MSDLRTLYAGLQLKNPIIAGACNLVTETSNLKALEHAGVAAIVYKSLFEERAQIKSLQGHLDNLTKAKEMLKIPIIGSLNCATLALWGEYAQKMAETGIDALELNFYTSETDISTDPSLIEENQVETLNLVRRSVKIPVTVKLSPYYTNTMLFISELDHYGVDGFVLFNRLFLPDIDIDRQEHHFPYNFSSENDNRLALRYAGLMYNNVKASICCNTGILSGTDIIKMILAGADTVQIVSALYKKGISHVTYMLREIDAWMEKKDYYTLEQFRGKLSSNQSSNPEVYRRSQYVDILTSY